MKEEYLHYLHRFKLLGKSFKTVDGKQLEIVDFGYQNVNAGPDFLNAAVNLDGQLWVGPIEFHVHSSDWYLHNHQNDERYSNVIAHFVYLNDREVQSGGYTLPTVELKSKIDADHYKRFSGLAGSSAPIACHRQVGDIAPFIIFQQKEKALAQRLTRKSQLVLDDIRQNKGDLEKAFYLALARIFGGKVNAAAFEHLVQRLDIPALKRTRLNTDSIPAVLFGLAGLLPEESGDTYVKRLIDEFEFQSHRQQLVPMNAVEWRYSRMHPGSFPDIRLAQFAAILQKGISVDSLFSPDVSVHHLRELVHVQLPLFWRTHYRFDTKKKEKPTVLANGFVDLIIINAIVPFVFAIGLLHDSQVMKEMAVDLLTRLKPEQNAILRSWSQAGVTAVNAFDSQALIEQTNALCSAKKCLFCSIGIKLLRA